MRQKIVAGNWKMNKTLPEAQTLTSEITHMLADEVSPAIQVIIAPPFVYLSTVGQLIKSQPNISLAAQNCYQTASGAFTGEISAPMLASLGVAYVILGHSERRMHFQETSAQVAEKVDSVLQNGMQPIFCCGESLNQREQGMYADFVRQQVTESLFHLDTTQLARVVIAYEPIWAIGTGKTATSAQAQEMHEIIRTHVAGKYGAEAASKLTILYGGSCNPANARELFGCPDVDGGLIGGASLKSRDFVDIAKSFGSA